MFDNDLEQKTDEMLMTRDKEIMGLKQELQKVRATSEQEVKKYKKAQHTKHVSTNQTVILTTNGSNDPAPNGKLDYSFDPYSTGGRKATQQEYSTMGRDLRASNLKKRPNLNSTMMDSSEQQHFHTEGFDSSEVIVSSGSGRQKSNLFSQRSGIFGLGSRRN